MPVSSYLVAHFHTHTAASSAINEFARVTMVPVLVTELSSGLSERTQLLIERFIILYRGMEGVHSHALCNYSLNQTDIPPLLLPLHHHQHHPPIETQE